ncbi:MAG: hypothetical protein M1824_001311 [Vezdaea acicularis]|nr:MAG: hypothetical protein M1824_001311 [Vezdaea acicularis]
MARKSAFQKFWETRATRELVLSYLSPPEQASLRLVSQSINYHVTPTIFSAITITFRSGTFTRPARIAALERIGHFIRAVTFSMPHTPSTFLAPLLDPITGEEQQFFYDPQLSPAVSPGSREPKPQPKYGSPQMTDLLVQQYSPLFHAATNITAFLRAFTSMPSLAALTISCPGQEAAFRYRRSAVDYALISLRMAIERAPLPCLDTLTLDPIHPGAIFYLRPFAALGALPASARRWRQIKHLNITMESWDFTHPQARSDHLMMLHEYLSTLSPHLNSLSFSWSGSRGPSPFTLENDEIMIPPQNTESIAPRAPGPLLKALVFPRLRHMHVANALMAEEQVASLIERHAKTIRTADFEEVKLRDGGSWDIALDCLTRITGSSKWRQGQRQMGMETPQPASPSSLPSSPSLPRSAPPPYDAPNTDKPLPRTPVAEVLEDTIRPGGRNSCFEEEVPLMMLKPVVYARGATATATVTEASRPKKPATQVLSQPQSETQVSQETAPYIPISPPCILTPIPSSPIQPPSQTISQTCLPSTTYIPTRSSSIRRKPAKPELRRSKSSPQPHSHPQAKPHPQATSHPAPKTPRPQLKLDTHFPTHTPPEVHPHHLIASTSVTHHHPNEPHRIRHKPSISLPTLPSNSLNHAASQSSIHPSERHPSSTHLPSNSLNHAISQSTIHPLHRTNTNITNITTTTTSTSKGSRSRRIDQYRYQSL